MYIQYKQNLFFGKIDENIITTKKESRRYRNLTMKFIYVGK